MPVNLTEAAFASVVVVGIVLFATGRPDTRTPEPTPVAATPVAATPVAATPVAATPVAATQVAAAQPPAAQPPAAPPTPAPTTVTASGITLTSVRFDLPTTERAFPGGPAADAVNANCTACHSPGMILTQPKLTETGWHDEITKMRAVFKAPIADDAVPAIVAYLTAMKPGG